LSAFGRRFSARSRSAQQLELPRRVAAGRRDRARAERLAAAVPAESAREQAVAPRDLEHVARRDPARRETARDDLTEYAHVFFRVCANRWVPGGTRRGVDARELRLRHRE